MQLKDNPLFRYPLLRLCHAGRFLNFLKLLVYKIRLVLPKFFSHFSTIVKVTFPLSVRTRLRAVKFTVVKNKLSIDVDF